MCGFYLVLGRKRVNFSTLVDEAGSCVFSVASLEALEGQSCELRRTRRLLTPDATNPMPIISNATLASVVSVPVYASPPDV